MRIALLLSLLILLSCADKVGPASAGRSSEKTNGPAEAGPTSCIADWTSLADGIEYRALKCPDIALHLVRVDPKIAIVEAKLQSGTAREAAGESLFALNANFFDTNLRALGVVMSNGKVLNSLHKVDWQSVFAISKDGAARIITVPEWSKVQRDMSTAVQAGPRLVVSGAKNKVAQARLDLRSGVCIQNDGRVIFFATPPLPLFDVWQMVDLAHKDEAAGGLGCQDAMLFDGGPSTQLFVRLPDREIEVEGDKRVPAFVSGRARSK